MKDENDITHHPSRPIQHKPLVLVAIALLIALVAGAGEYLLGSRKSQWMSQNHQMQYQQLAVVSPAIATPAADATISFTTGHLFKV